MRGHIQEKNLFRVHFVTNHFLQYQADMPMRKAINKKRNIVANFATKLLSSGGLVKGMKLSTREKKDTSACTVLKNLLINGPKYIMK